MLKTIGSFVVSASRVDDNEVVSSGVNSVGAKSRSVGGLNMSRKTIKTKSRIKNGHLGEIKFLISKARKAFNCLRQAFTKASILQHFDLKYHI